MGGVLTGLLLVAAAGSPEGRAAPRDEQMRLTLDVADSEGVPDLGAFLAERASGTWGAEAIAQDGTTARFRVQVSWPAERSVKVAVDEKDVRLADRILVVTDAGAAKLTIWLLVKSTINRAMLGSVPVGPRPEPPPAAHVGPSPVPLPAPLSFATILVFSLGQPQLFSAGAGFGVAWLPWSQVSLGGELGYRFSPGVIGMLIHHVPVRLNAGWSVDPGRAVTVGLAAIADLKVALAGGRRAAALGLEAGGFLALHLPLSKPGASFLLRGTVTFRSIRQRYLIDGDAVSERLWDICVSTGATW